MHKLKRLVFSLFFTCLIIIGILIPFTFNRHDEVIEMHPNLLARLIEEDCVSQYVGKQIVCEGYYLGYYQKTQEYFIVYNKFDFQSWSDVLVFHADEKLMESIGEYSEIRVSGVLRAYKHYYRLENVKVEVIEQVDPYDYVLDVNEVQDKQRIQIYGRLAYSKEQVYVLIDGNKTTYLKDVSSLDARNIYEYTSMVLVNGTYHKNKYDSINVDSMYCDFNMDLSDIGYTIKEIKDLIGKKEAKHGDLVTMYVTLDLQKGIIYDEESKEEIQLLNYEFLKDVIINDQQQLLISGTIIVEDDDIKLDVQYIG